MNEITALAQFDRACYKYANEWIKYPSIAQAFDIEDLAQIARMYVILAVREYKDDQGMTLSTYIITRIRWGLNTTLRSFFPKNNKTGLPVLHVSFGTLLGREEDRLGNGEVLPSLQYHDAEPEEFEEMISFLPLEDQELVKARYLEELSLVEIGKKARASREWVRLRLLKITETLGENYA